ncbi:MAG TPA: hypothetical protein VHN14_28950 [Kofleriaceae bacterium]|jgi:hypothetical protein|nr:hypothetical protein [Kofleriaceae bacterium]
MQSIRFFLPLGMLATGALATTASASYRFDAPYTWPTTNIAVCFSGTDVFTAGSPQAELIRTIAESEFHVKTRIRFHGWDSCSATPLDQPFITVSFDTTRLTDGRPPAGPGGHGTMNFVPRIFTSEGTPDGQRDAVIHEFGHALGLMHENSRTDTYENCVDSSIGRGSSAIENRFGPYDPTSVMTTCRTGTITHLSQGDVNTLNDWYGWPGDFVIAMDGTITRYHDEPSTAGTLHEKCRIVNGDQYAAFDDASVGLPAVRTPPAGSYVDTGDCVWPPKLYRLPDLSVWFLGDLTGSACRVQDDVQLQGYGGGLSARIVPAPASALITGRPAPLRGAARSHVQWVPVLWLQQPRTGRLHVQQSRGYAAGQAVRADPRAAATAAGATPYAAAPARSRSGSSVRPRNISTAWGCTASGSIRQARSRTTSPSPVDQPPRARHVARHSPSAALTARCSSASICGPGCSSTSSGRCAPGAPTGSLAQRRRPASAAARPTGLRTPARAAMAVRATSTPATAARRWSG